MQSGLNNLRLRLDYRGGINQENRMQKDKENSLKKALLYSYQAATIILEDGRMFRCLINTDKTKPDYDIKTISIPYKDICLGKVDKDGKEILKNPENSKIIRNKEIIGLKCGDVFKWKETNTYWICYLENLEEDAYFRSEIYKCEEEVIINDKKYHIYIRGPVETTIQWNIKKTLTWSDLNYSLIIYITKNKDTLDYFHRFKTIKINNKVWEVKTVDPYSADGIIEICLGEYFNNELNEQYLERLKIEEEKMNLPSKEDKYIEGDKIVHPYETHRYTIHGLDGGNWEIDNFKKATFEIITESTIEIKFITGKSCKIKLKYTTDDREVILPIEVRSI